MKSYRIYINSRTLLFTDRMPKQFDTFEQLDADNFDFPALYRSLKKNRHKNFVLLSKKPKKVFNELKRKLTIIKAAGGLVENAKGEFLFIFRNKKWDLPKGKVEKAENMKTAAVREVEEECGVKIEKRGKRICKTYHIYELNGKMIFKKTNWYKMHVKGVPRLIPQKEEGITTATWVDVSGIASKTKNTYPLIIDVLQAQKLID